MKRRWRLREWWRAISWNEGTEKYLHDSAVYHFWSEICNKFMKLTESESEQLYLWDKFHETFFRLKLRMCVRVMSLFQIWQRNISHRSHATLSTLNSERNFYALPFSICKAYGFHQIIINHLYHGRFWDDAPSLPQHLLGVHHVSTVTKYSRAVTRAKRVCFLLFIYFCRKYFHIIHENSLCWHVKGLKVETMTWKISCTHCSTRNTCVWLFVLIIHLFQFNITEKKILLCPTNSSDFVLQIRSNTREKNNRSKIFRFFSSPSEPKLSTVFVFDVKTNKEKTQSVSAYHTKETKLPTTASISSFSLTSVRHIVRETLVKVTNKPKDCINIENPLGNRAIEKVWLHQPDLMAKGTKLIVFMPTLVSNWIFSEWRRAWWQTSIEATCFR